MLIWTRASRARVSSHNFPGGSVHVQVVQGPVLSASGQAPSRARFTNSMQINVPLFAGAPSAAPPTSGGSAEGQHAPPQPLNLGSLISSVCIFFLNVTHILF